MNAAAEHWFLRRGLPAVLPGRARWHRVWQRLDPGDYRAEFVEPALDDLRLTLVARNRYWGHIPDNRHDAKAPAPMAQA